MEKTKATTHFWFNMDVINQIHILSRILKIVLFYSKKKKRQFYDFIIITRSLDCPLKEAMSIMKLGVNSVEYTVRYYERFTCFQPIINGSQIFWSISSMFPILSFGERHAHDATYKRSSDFTQSSLSFLNFTYRTFRHYHMSFLIGL